MTNIMHHDMTVPATSRLISAVNQAAAWGLSFGLRLATGLVRTAAAIPAAINGAATMTYADPYSRPMKANDPSDPRNF